MLTIKPNKLNRADTIGIISPSQYVDLFLEHKLGFEKGIERLKQLGFKVKLSSNCKAQYFYSAGTPEQRASDIHEMFLDKEVRAILISIGGDTGNEVLPLIDFELIKSNPKIIMGMSDGSTFLTSITDKTELITFYGPDLIYSFGIQHNADLFNKQIFRCIMEGNATFDELKDLVNDDGLKIETGWQTIRKGKVSGQLIGGYLEILNELIALKYLEILEDRILYLESMEASPIIHMRLQMMKMLGVFEKISGLIIGYFPDIEKEQKFYRPIGDIIVEMTKEKTFPILRVNELGHMVKNYAWPNGLRVELDADNKKITALENCVI